MVYGVVVTIERIREYLDGRRRKGRSERRGIGECEGSRKGRFFWICR